MSEQQPTLNTCRHGHERFPRGDERRCRQCVAADAAKVAQEGLEPEAKEYVVVTIWKPRGGREVSHAYGLYTLKQANKEKYHLMQHMGTGEGKGSCRVLKMIDLDAMDESGPPPPKE